MELTNLLKQIEDELQTASARQDLIALLQERPRLKLLQLVRLEQIADFLRDFVLAGIKLTQRIIEASTRKSASPQLKQYESVLTNRWSSLSTDPNTALRNIEFACFALTSYLNVVEPSPRRKKDRYETAIEAVQFLMREIDLRHYNAIQSKILEFTREREVQEPGLSSGIPRIRLVSLRKHLEAITLIGILQDYPRRSDLTERAFFSNVGMPKLSAEQRKTFERIYRELVLDLVTLGKIAEPSADQRRESERIFITNARGPSVDQWTMPCLYNVWFATNRAPVNPTDTSKGYTNERDPKGAIHYGSCAVYIPRTHEFGSVGSSFWKRLRKLKFTNNHLELRKIESFDTAEEFFVAVRREMESRQEPSGKSMLVYLHGYNTTFEQAALRSAQIGFDLKIETTAFYSWPSIGNAAGYPADIARIEASEKQIAEFLTDIATKAGVDTVHIIAHSMGNRGFARAISRITSYATATSRIHFGQIILAAPDIDVDLFKQLAVAYPKISERTTMYVSAKDKALEISGWLQDSDRAGYTPPVTVIDGVDTVEVTNIDLTILGHDYYAEAEAVLYDMKELIDSSKPPKDRIRLEPVAIGKTRYWTIHR
jgi:esterase/lipase superfamily enzyme